MSLRSKWDAVKLGIGLMKQHYNWEHTRREWRRRNPHNGTTAVLDTGLPSFPMDFVHVGNHTYGPLRCLLFSGEEPGLFIGHCCSIARDVTFILGGEHNYHLPSTFAWNRIAGVSNSHSEHLSKGPIILEDDVWIGTGSTILSGVTLRRDEVVAAGSVVTTSSEPYSIIGGNPARHIKYRFAPEIIQKLMQIDYAHLTADKIIQHQALLHTEVTPENVDNIVSALQS